MVIIPVKYANTFRFAKKSNKCNKFNEMSF